MEDLIYNQRNIPKDQWRYGFRTSAATGCGWIATYNALRIMGKEADPEQLLRFYERMLPVIHGNFGTTILAPAFYFMRKGYRVKWTACPEKFDALAKASDACVLFYRWRKKWKIGGHFVALHHTQEGFLGYNTYRSSSGPDRYGESISAFLKEKKYFVPVLISICHPEENAQ